MIGTCVLSPRLLTVTRARTRYALSPRLYTQLRELLSGRVAIKYIGLSAVSEGLTLTPTLPLTPTPTLTLTPTLPLTPTPLSRQGGGESRGSAGGGAIE